ncbi:MAG TPA: PspC domain-containing protein [Saprospiraceae bacterium]|nr:PspC domain-containing protein [Saprospiraceae bacterium]
MNKVLNINVGKYPFSIDDIAYEKLDSYLLSLQNHFSKSEGCKDIMQDIESRIAELFQEKLSGRSIVSIEIVDETISIMGTPEIFGTDWNQPNDPTESKSNSQYTTEDWGIKTGKKLFRDPSDSKIGGVCSGLAQYIGIQDVIWVRLFFVLTAFAGGFAAILYVILWVITPEARNSADRLAMKGEPINVHNIARKVEEEIDDLTHKFDNWREKRRMRKKNKWRF